MWGTLSHLCPPGFTTPSALPAQHKVWVPAGPLAALAGSSLVEDPNPGVRDREVAALSFTSCCWEQGLLEKGTWPCRSHTPCRSPLPMAGLMFCSKASAPEAEGEMSPWERRSPPVWKGTDNQARILPECTGL